MAAPDELSECEEWWLRAVARGPRLGPARTRTAGWELVAAETRDELGALGVVAARRGFILTRPELTMAGVDEAAVRRRVRSGRYTAPRRGFVCPLPRRDDGRPGATAAEIGIAAAVRSRNKVLASHESAAALRGLPVLFRPDRVQSTTDARSHSGGWPDHNVHAAGIAAPERDSWFGVPMTSVARTLVDIARRSGVSAGLVTADAALREGLVTEGALELSVAWAHQRPGVVAAKRVVELARAGSESPLESLTRLCLIDGGLPHRLELQATIHTDRGPFRVDLYIRERNVVIEADGELKYAGERGGRALWKEKQRQDALERAGCRIVRVTWNEVLSQPQAVVARVLRACVAPSLVF